MSRRKRLFGASLGLAAVVLLLASSAAVAKPARSFFGVTSQRWLEDADFERMQRAGVGALRFDLNWSTADPQPGGLYDWGPSDRLVRGAAIHGIRALPYAYDTPDWVAKLDGFDCEGCGTFAPRGTEALVEWRDFLAAAVRRYGPDGTFWAENPYIPKLPIRVWQLWNEQNSPTFYSPRPDVGAYAGLVRAGREGVTSEDGGAEIVLGGMFGTPRGGQKPSIAAWDFLAELYDLGAKRDFDTVAAHPYAGRLDDVIQQVHLLRREMRMAGDREAGLRITEFGWASAGPEHPLNRGSRGQAKRLSQAFAYFAGKRRKLKIRGLAWYSWRDNVAAGAGVCEWCPYSGLVDEELNAKPALRAFTNFTGGT